jgi:hypothetical protein
MKATLIRQWLIVTSFVALSPSVFSYGQSQTATFVPNAEYSMRVLKSFRQATKGEGSIAEGNCAAIALIKAAMATFGAENVITFREDAGIYTFVFLDAFTETMTSAEEKHAEEQSGFHLPTVNGVLAGDPALMNLANKIWAAMAKRKNPQNLDQALKDLRTGGNIKWNTTLLGLSLSSPGKGNRAVAYMHANGYHAAFATGDVYDSLGFPGHHMAFMSGHVGPKFWKDLVFDDRYLPGPAPRTP